MINVFVFIMEEKNKKSKPNLIKIKSFNPLPFIATIRSFGNGSKNLSLTRLKGNLGSDRRDKILRNFHQTGREGAHMFHLAHLSRDLQLINKCICVYIKEYKTSSSHDNRLTSFCTVFFMYNVICADRSQTVSHLRNYIIIYVYIF